MARELIVFDDGTPAIVYNKTDIGRSRRFMRDLLYANSLLHVPEKKKTILIYNKDSLYFNQERKVLA